MEFRVALVAAPLSLVLLSPGCDAGEPSPASAGAPRVAETKDEGATPTVAGVPKDEGATPGVPTAEPEGDALPDKAAPAQVSGGPGEPMPFASEAVVKAAAEVAGKAKKDWIPGDALEGADAALAVLHLAQTAEDPQLAGAALASLPRLYSGRKREGYRPVDADYVAVVVRRLTSGDPAVLKGALAAADVAAEVEPPDPRLLAALLTRAGPGQPPEARVQALGHLASIEPLTREIQQAFLTGLEDEDPAMVALTLSAFSLFSSRFADREPLIQRLWEMASSEHAGVRGNALTVLSQVERSAAHREATTKLALKMLKDEHPLVRGSAAYALGTMRVVEHADKLIAMMDDNAPARMRLDGWTNLDGSSADKMLMAGGAGTVTHTALLSLAIISTATDSDFAYADLVERKPIGEEPDYTAAVAAAKAWVEARRSE